MRGRASRELQLSIDQLRALRTEAAAGSGGSPALASFLRGVRRDERNISLLATRQHHAEGPWGHVTATRDPAESSALDPFDIATQFPLYVYVDVRDREAAQGQFSLDLTMPGAAP